MQLFISYAHADEAKVRQMVEILRAGGHNPWFDEWLLPGQDWQEELAHIIGGCDALVYALTPEAAASEWCQWEFGKAIELGKPVVPVMLAKDVPVPAPLRRTQFADFSDEPGSAAYALAVARLIGGLGRLAVSIPPEDAPDIPQPVQSGLIRTVQYDAASSVLEVTFQHGGIYQYNDVPPDVAEALIAAASPGRYFNRHVKQAYPFRRIN